MTIKKLAVVPVLLALSACGGGGDGGGTQPSAFDQLALEGTELYQDYINAPATPIASMPTGSQTYNGVAAYSDSSTGSAILQDEDLLSRVQIIANFDQNTVDGKLYDFVNVQNNRATGEATLRNGTITNNTFSADVSGNVTFQGNVNTVNGSTTGDFVGNGANAVRGEVSAFVDGVSMNGIYGAD